MDSDQFLCFIEEGEIGVEGWEEESVEILGPEAVGHGPDVAGRAMTVFVKNFSHGVAGLNDDFFDVAGQGLDFRPCDYRGQG